MKLLASKVGMRVAFALAALVLASAVTPRSHAQEPAAQKKVTPLKVQVVISEFDGEKKVGSLPYVFYVMADAERDNRTSVRMGLRVPIRAGGSGESSQYQYQDVGTNLDCSAHALPDGSYALVLTVQRSSLYLSGSEAAGDGQSSRPNPNVVPNQPIIQNFSTGIQISARDGQTVQSNLAADPVNGHVLKVDVTVNVVK
jgi:hypothetical protein